MWGAWEPSPHSCVGRNQSVSLTPGSVSGPYRLNKCVQIRTEFRLHRGLGGLKEGPLSSPSSSQGPSWFHEWQCPQLLQAVPQGTPVGSREGKGARPVCAGRAKRQVRARWFVFPFPKQGHLDRSPSPLAVIHTFEIIHAWSTMRTPRPPTPLHFSLPPSRPWSA